MPQRHSIEQRIQLSFLPLTSATTAPKQTEPGEQQQPQGRQLFPTKIFEIFFNFERDFEFLELSKIDMQWADEKEGRKSKRRSSICPNEESYIFTNCPPRKT